jgi:hypothetical protein
MAITTLDGYIASSKQVVLQKKTASITSVAQMITSPFAAAGLPGAGTLAGTSTANGVVPTDATAGCPDLTDFAGGATGYITRLTGYSSVATTLYLCDLLFKAGAYAFNASVTLESQPSYAGRVPTNNRGNTFILLEAVTAFTGNQSIRILYDDWGDVARDTGVIATGVAPIIGRCYQVPLVAAGNGVKKINQVISSVSSAGTFNVLVLRELAMMRIPVVGYGESRDLYGTGMPQIYQDSALVLYTRPDSTAAGLPEWEIEIASG